MMGRERRTVSRPINEILGGCDHETNVIRYSSASGGEEEAGRKKLARKKLARKKLVRKKLVRRRRSD
jgi:hypothetical protein